MIESFSIWHLLLVLVIGAAAGFINVLAGGGSFLTLPLLIFLGLPPNLANGTNRLAIVMQNVFSVGSFMRQKIYPGRFGVQATLWALPGGILGAWMATQVSNDQFRASLAIFMIIMSLYTLFNKQRQGQDPIDPESYSGGWLGPGIGYFLVGIYGGYIQAGVGFLIITVLLMQNINLVHGNAIKLTIITFFSITALIIFQHSGLVHWGMGAMLGVGNMLGGWLGTHVAIRKGHIFIQRTVTVAVVVFALKLLFSN
jgi:hypothetical protein